MAEPPRVSAVSSRSAQEAGADRETESERKQVTILFADLVGSTALASVLDPEDMVELLNQVFEGWVAAVHRYGGTVDKFLGDGMLALFGAPLAHEDDPRRAALAALEIIASTRALPEGIEYLETRVGLNTGLAVVGRVGADARTEYTAIGDVVNVAQRVEASARPGTVFCTESTRRAIAPYFEMGPAGEFELKGKSEPLPLFEVVADLGVTRTVRGIDGAASSLVGRETELHSLVTALDRVVDGRGTAMALVGDAGLGKSRLLEELRREALGRGVRWATGHALSFGAATPYLPIRELVRELDPDSPIFAADSSLDPEARHRATVAAVRRLAISHSPIVIVVEDLHWADQPTFDVVASLARATEDQPLLLVVTSRPETSTEAAMIDIPAIHLTPLDPGATLVLVHQLLAGAPLTNRLTDTILERSQGNPFFAEELVRSLTESTTGAGPNEGSTAGRGWEEVLPATLDGLITSRIDRLPPSAKRLLQAASVIGRSFTEMVLERVEEVGEGDLSLLIDAGFLVPSQSQYSFKHALTQEAAYRGLLKRSRSRLHLRVARALEELFPEEVAERAADLGRHYDLGGETAQAIVYLGMAATRSAAEYANSSALSSLNRALELVADPTDRLSLLDLRSEVLVRVGSPEEAGRDAEEMLALAGDDSTVLRARVALARAAVRSDYLKAREPLESALDLAGQLGDDITRARLLRLLASHLMSQYDPKQAAACLAEALPIFAAAGLESERVGALDQMSVAQRVEQGEMEPWAEETLAAARRLGDPLLMAKALIRMGEMAMDEERLEAALDLLDEAKAMAIEIDVADLLIDCHRRMALVLRMLGRPEEADVHHLAGIRLARSSGYEWGWLVSVMNMVESWETAQHIGALHSWLTEQIPDVEQQGHSANLSYFHYALAFRVMRWFGSWSQGLEYAEGAARAVAETDHIPPQVMYRNALARMLIALGDFVRARQVLDEAFDLAQTHGTMSVSDPFLMITEALLSLAQGDLGSAERAVADLEGLGTGWEYAGERQAAAYLGGEVALAGDDPVLAVDRARSGLALEPLPAVSGRWFSRLQLLDLLARALEAAGDEGADEAWSMARDELEGLWLPQVPPDYVQDFLARPEVMRVMAATGSK